jgi:hypothetical protein
MPGVRKKNAGQGRRPLIIFVTIDSLSSFFCQFPGNHKKKDYDTGPD